MRWGPRSPTRPAWTAPPVLAVAGLSVGSGIAAYGVTVLIGDVAATFGRADADVAFTDLGMPVTAIGVALAVIRLASVGGLPIAALADRHGRRGPLLIAAGLGFALTAASAAAPGFWWYVVLVACARPFLSAVNALATVVAAEEVRSTGRSAAVALIAAAYGIGSGLVAVGRGVLPGEPGFRVVAVAALLPLLAVPLLARTIREPPLAAAATHPDATGDAAPDADADADADGHPIPGAVPRRWRGRVAVLASLVGALAVATGPGLTYLFVYGEQVLGLAPLRVAALVLAAGPTGLAGLVVGRWAADHLGRRPTAAASMVGVGAAVALAYTGPPAAYATGYLLTILLASAFTPAQGALAAELVPTAVRATLSGWITVASVLGAIVGLLTFGVLADLTGSFAPAAWLLGAVTAVAALGFRVLPETRGIELEDLDGDTAS